MNQIPLRANVLIAHGASSSEVTELLAYNQNQFDQSSLDSPLAIPLDSEPHIAVWRQYAEEAEQMGVYAALKPRLVQLQFPIQAGISDTEDYRVATRKGHLPQNSSLATGLVLQQPETLELVIHPTLAGEIPVVVAGCRADFVRLIQALTKRNEPYPIPDSMGACILGGYNNWDRVRRYRQEWETHHPLGNWNAEFKRLVSHKSLYQDQLMILSQGAYSHVRGGDLGLTESEWLNLSRTIRLEHECTHYLTRRLWGLMRNNLLDELIADYRGLVAAIHHYRADWFLQFMGLESYPSYREGGRLQNYRGDPPMSEGAFRVLQSLLKTAAENLERFDRRFGERPRTLSEQIAILRALTTLTLEELASAEAETLLETAVNHQALTGLGI